MDGAKSQSVQSTRLGPERTTRPLSGSEYREGSVKTARPKKERGACNSEGADPTWSPGRTGEKRGTLEGGGNAEELEPWSPGLNQGNAEQGIFEGREEVYRFKIHSFVESGEESRRKANSAKTDIK